MDVFCEVIITMFLFKVCLFILSKDMEIDFVDLLGGLVPTFHVNEEVEPS